MEHKRCVLHIARDSANAMQSFMGRALPVDVDTVIAGAILADLGKLLEYEIGPDGKSRQSERGEALRHPFTGVALALECGVPDAVCHIIAAHAAEGDLVKRTRRLGITTKTPSNGCQTIEQGYCFFAVAASVVECRACKRSCANR
jgi:putative nucleotidyltransferase with HDIG domain